jgi:hypothetical protein
MLLDDFQTEALLLRHLKFFMENFEGLESVTTWSELKSFDTHTVASIELTLEK